MQSDPAPVVASLADARSHASRYVAVEGVYEQRDVRMRRADPDELLAGHVALVLDDGGEVYLYSPDDDEALRSEEERERLEHRRVRAVGLLFATMAGDAASITAPCLVDISSIELAE